MKNENKIEENDLTFFQTFNEEQFIQFVNVII